MILLKFILIYFSISYLTSKIMDIKIEKSLLISTGLIHIVLYIFGIFNILKYGVYLIYAVSFVSFLYFLYELFKSKGKLLKKVITPAMIIWMIAIIIIYFICAGSVFVEWDEFSHWGPNLKAMYYHDILWANKLWDGVHVVYPPLSGIVEYFGLKLYGTYSEWVAYISLDIFMLNFFVVIFRKLKNNIGDYIKGFIGLLSIFCFIYIFHFKLTSLYIDLCLAVLFFIGLYISSLKMNKENITMLIIMFILLPILKDSGLIFSAIILINLFVRNVLIDIFRNKKINGKDFKKLLPYVALVLIIFSAYFSSKAYATLNGQTVDFKHDSNNVMELDLKEYVNSIFLKTSVSKNYDITRSFYDYLNSNKIISNYPFGTIIQLILVLNIIFIIFYYASKKKEKDRIISSIASLNLGALLYFMFLLLVFLFAFLEREGRVLASFERYSSTFFLGFIFYIIALIYENKNNIAILSCLMIAIFGINIPTLVMPANQKVSPIGDPIRQNASVINNNLNVDDKVYLVIQNTDGCSFHMLRYLISPIKTNLLYEWNVGDKNTVLDLFTINLTIDEWKEKLINEKFSYVYLVSIDEYFVENYSSMFGYNLDFNDLNGSLYKITNRNNNLVFERLEI